MARLGDILSIAGHMTGSPQITGLGKYFTGKRKTKKKREHEKELAKIRSNRNYKYDVKASPNLSSLSIGGDRGYRRRRKNGDEAYT